MGGSVGVLSCREVTPSPSLSPCVCGRMCGWVGQWVCLAVGRSHPPLLCLPVCVGGMWMGGSVGVLSCKEVTPSPSLYPCVCGRMCGWVGQWVCLAVGRSHPPLLCIPVCVGGCVDGWVSGCA